MDNHYHLLVENPEGNLSSGMRQLNGMYTQYANRAHNTAGHVFQGRYKSILVEKGAYLLELCRYIVLNPVRAGICDHPLQWRWSSYRATATGEFAGKEKFLMVAWVLRQFAPQKTIARQRYMEFVHDGCLNPSSPWGQLRVQVVYGSETFLDGLRLHLKGQTLAEEIPKVQRYAGRPQLNELFNGAGRGSKAQRDADIVKAHLEFGYTQKQIATHVGLHYSTVSKIVSTNSE